MRPSDNRTWWGFKASGLPSGTEGHSRWTHRAPPESCASLQHLPWEESTNSWPSTSVVCVIVGCGLTDIERDTRGIQRR